VDDSTPDVIDYRPTVGESERELLAAVEAGLIDGDSEQTERMIKAALEFGVSPNAIVNNALLPGMSLIGRRFRDNEVYVPDVILAADAMQTGLDLLRPQLADSHIDLRRKIIIGTVRNDLHDLGKTIICCSLIAAGFDVIDLGVNVPASVFIEALAKEKPSVVALSCTLSYTLTDLQATVEEIRRDPLGRDVTIIVGGLAVTPAFADSIGADWYSLNAEQVVLLLQRLLHEQRV